MFLFGAACRYKKLIVHSLEIKEVNCTYMVKAIIPDYIIVYKISGIFFSCDNLCFLSSLGYCVALMGRMGREWQFRRKINKGGEMGMIWLSAHNLLH